MITIYHNPHCTKSRQTLALLREHGVEPEIIDYLKTPPSTTELKRLVKFLGLTPRELLRTKEPEYKAARLDRATASDEDIVRAIVKHPRLMERPIVVKGGKAVLGRPPENVLKIL
ncbi:MAG: arsenate reductase (glutaredoxin) [Pseudomonadota bacterium]|nr:MAG: arsenate reductase (glutaredoxin) [Pseudomonadota bacterium]